MARPVGRRGETRERVVQAALDLFTEHGVGGTSLQMIADRLGVTKAAVYHQFQSKDDIVLAVVQPALEQIRAVVRAAEATPEDGRRRGVVVEGLIDLVLDHRRIMAALHSDPGVAEALKARCAVLADIERLHHLLLGPDPTLSDVVATAMLGGGLMSIGVDGRLSGIAREALRAELLAAARRLVQL